MNLVDNAGFVVIATGTDHYIEMAKGLARSLEWAGMLAPRTVITNRPDTELRNFYHQVIIDRALPNSFQAKLWAVDLSPYDNMVFIDVDCLVYERFRLPAEPKPLPFVAFGEEVTDQDWFGLTPEFVRSLGANGGRYSILHTGIFRVRKCRDAVAIFRRARELEPLIQEHTGKHGIVPDEILLSVSAALHGVTDFWDKDESLLSPSILWSSPPTLDIRRRIASTCCAGRWTSPRIVHFIHGFKDSRVYRREIKRLEAVIPRCHLEISASSGTAWSWRAVHSKKQRQYRWWMRTQGIK